MRALRSAQQSPRQCQLRCGSHPETKPRDVVAGPPAERRPREVLRRQPYHRSKLNQPDHATWKLLRAYSGHRTTRPALHLEPYLQERRVQPPKLGRTDPILASPHPDLDLKNRATTYSVSVTAVTEPLRQVS